MAKENQTKEKQLLMTYFAETIDSPLVLAEKMEQVGEVEQALTTLMALCGDDPAREGLQETPYRFVKAFLEYTQGYREDPKHHLDKVFDVPHQELVLVKDIEFYSMCEHHFAPFFGVAQVGYIPNEKVTGLSKIARMVEGYARRFQVQERLTTQIAEALESELAPLGTMVVIEAKHLCMCSRGVKKASTKTVTSSVHGVFAKEASSRAEFLTLIKD